MMVEFKARVLARLGRPWPATAVATVGVLMLTAGFLAGSRYFDGEMEARRDLDRALAEARHQLDIQRQLLMNSGIAGQVDRQSLEQVRKTVAKLESELLERRNELDLYRNLLKDDGGGVGLSVEPPRITGSADTGYAYRIAVRQRAVVLKTVKAVVDVKLLGEKEGDKASYTLAELDPSLGRGPVEVAFKYFQVIEGNMTLPAGFTPRQISITVRQAGGYAAREEIFNWSVENL